MNKEIAMVRECMNTYEQARFDWPTTMTGDQIKFRAELMVEELHEFTNAAFEKDLVGMADGLADMLYVLLGTAEACGMGNILPALFAEVHRANMSKLGIDGKPIKRDDGKFLKGPNYTPPDLKTIVDNAYPNSF